MKKGVKTRREKTVWEKRETTGGGTSLYLETAISQKWNSHFCSQWYEKEWTVHRGRKTREDLCMSESFPIRDPLARKQMRDEIKSTSTSSYRDTREWRNAFCATKSQLMRVLSNRRNFTTLFQKRRRDTNLLIIEEKKRKKKNMEQGFFQFHDLPNRFYGVADLSIILAFM